jgi:RNA polymerase sigma-70 factor, ECF subfamily
MSVVPNSCRFRVRKRAWSRCHLWRGAEPESAEPDRGRFQPVPRRPCSEESRLLDPRPAREAWVLATLPRAVAFATSLLRDRAIAEDVVHDCYVRLLEKADTYDLPADGTKLLYRAITNACIDRNYRDRRLLSLEVATAGGSAGNTPPSDTRSGDPHELAAHRELEEALACELNRLTVAQRGALELRSLGYSLEEIAEALGISSSHAGVLVHRARKTLAERLARFLEERPDE